MARRACASQGAVSAGVVAIVREVLAEHPAWVITKGGITSHDVLVEALGVRRAEVLGQLFAGTVSVFRALESRPESLGVPCIVFAGNVGNDDVARRGRRHPARPLMLDRGPEALQRARELRRRDSRLHDVHPRVHAGDL